MILKLWKQRGLRKHIESIRRYLKETEQVLMILYREGSDYFTFWWGNVAVKALMENTASSANFI